MTIKYNGFANYETWDVSLWLNNTDEELYKLARGMSAKQLKQLVTAMFKKDGRFGDLETKEELKLVEWQEVVVE